MINEESKKGVTSIQFQENELRGKMQTHDLSYNGMVPVRIGA